MRLQRRRRLSFKQNEAKLKREEIIFIANHELKNPLTAFGLQTRMLQEIVSSNNIDISKDFIAAIIKNNEKNVKRMESIINKIIAVAEKP